MAKAKHNGAERVEQITVFGGIDARSPNGGGSAAYDIKNFRIAADGSLVRRDGFSHLASLYEDVRCVHVYQDAEGEYLLAVAGARLYRVSLSDGALESASALFTSEGAASFFTHGGELYLCDGAEVYHYRGGLTLVPCMGYVPLYGKDWSFIYNTNSVHEPINLLCPKIRVHYLREYADEELTSFVVNVGMEVVSVDRVLIDGEEVAFTCGSSDRRLVHLSSVHYGSEVEVCLTVGDLYFRDADLRSSTHALLFDGFSDERLFLYGGNRADTLYVSYPVADGALAASRRMEPTSTGLYIPKGTESRVGNGAAITAAVKAEDRVMLCTADGAWITERLTEAELPLGARPRMRTLSQTLGSLAVGGGTALQGRMPVTLSRGGLYRWNIDQDLDRECETVCLSREIEPLVGWDFFGEASLLRVKRSDELWLFRPSDPEGRIWIYGCDGGAWYSFAGVRATHLFETGRGVGFADGKDVFLFRGGLDRDLLPLGDRSIKASVTGRRGDAGDREALKKATRLYLEAYAPKSEITVGLIDGNLLDEVSFAAMPGPAVYCAKVCTPRFHRVGYTLKAEGEGAVRIFGLCLHC